MTETSRKLATIDKISAIRPHPNADAIELATVRGWQVVVKKSEFKEGDLCVYCEIDSWIPAEIAPFLSKGKEPRLYKGIKGERLRTIKLRNEFSQGLILPISVLEKFGKLILSDNNRYSLIIDY
jgi:RNA ligase (TIGR02306 family)